MPQNESAQKQWGLLGTMRSGVTDLFPTRKTKVAMWGVVGLGVLTTYMELAAAQLFGVLITDIENQSVTTIVLMMGGFLFAFAAVRAITYFQSVYRLTVFGKALRQIPPTSPAAETWRWPMAIALVGMMGQLARLIAVTLAVLMTAWMFGVLLCLCSLVAVAIVNRTGRQQYEIHHDFVKAKLAGNPPSAAERIGTRIRAGERAGLFAVGPVLIYVVALGAGAAMGHVSASSALVLFIAGRMVSNMYGTLSNSSMRYIRAQVNVEAYGGSGSGSAGTSATADAMEELADDDILAAMSSGGYAWEPPSQAFARLVDDGRFVGHSTALGRVGRSAGFGPRQGIAKWAPAPRPDKIVAVAPRQVWLHDAYLAPIQHEHTPTYIHVIIDAFSRAIVLWRFDASCSAATIRAVFDEACGYEGVDQSFVELSSATVVVGEAPHLTDLLKSLGVTRTLLWTASDGVGTPPELRPSFPTKFESIDVASEWMAQFTRWYNEIFYQPDIGYLHPVDVHNEVADVVMTKRKATLARLAGGGATGMSAAMPREWSLPQEAWVARSSINTLPQPLPEEFSPSLEDDDS